MGLKTFLYRKWKQFKAFYHASSENRIGIYNILAFIIIPTIGMMSLYVWATIFWIP